MFPLDGVSTYLALTFGTLLSSQGTDASFGFPLGFPPGASLRCFTLYQAFSGFRTAAFLQTCRSAHFLSRDQDAGSATHSTGRGSLRPGCPGQMSDSTALPGARQIDSAGLAVDMWRLSWGTVSSYDLR